MHSLIFLLAILSAADPPAPDPAPPTVTLTPEQEERLSRRAAEILWDAVHQVLSPDLPTPPPPTPPAPPPTPPAPPPTPPAPPPTPPTPPAPAPEVRYVDDGDPGFVASGPKPNWRGWGQAECYGGDVTFGSDPTKDVGAYIFTVQAGTYRLHASWKALPNCQQQARYTVYAGNQLIGQVNADQTKPAVGFTDKNINWLPLGTYSVPAGNLSVHLTGIGAGSLSADAVRLETVPTTGPATMSRPIAPAAPEPTLAVPKLLPIVLGPSGSSLIVRAVDPDGVPLEISAGSAEGMVLRDQAGATLTPARPVVGPNEARVAYAVFPLPADWGSHAGLTLDAPAGWLMTALGPLDGVTALPVGGPAAAQPTTVPTGPRRLAVGWNTTVAYYFNTILPYADAMKGASAWYNGNPNLDADGFPLSTQGETGCQVISPQPCPVDPRGYASAPAGRWTLDWHGSGIARVVTPDARTTVVEVGTATTFGADGHRRAYDVAIADPTKANAPTLIVGAAGECRQIRLLAPGVPADGTPLYHPEYLRMLAGSRSLRAMAPMETGGNNVVDYADYPRTTQRTYCEVPERVRTVPIARLEDGSKWNSSFPADRLVVLATTAAPHGLVDGLFVGVGGLKTALKLGNGTFNPNGMTAILKVVSPTQFLMGFYDQRHTTVSVPYTDGCSIGIQTGHGQPPEDHVDLCNAVGADCWINVPHTASDACVRALATMIARRLKPGLKVRVELSNEHWNYYFAQWNHFAIQGLSASPPLTVSQEYARETARVHDLFAEVFAAAGRGSDLIRVYGSQAYNPAVTVEVVNWCQAHGKAIDELALALYLDNGPAMVRDELTVDQVADLGELWVHEGRGKLAPVIAPHSSPLKGAFSQARIVAYEGGPAYGQIGATTDDLKTRQSVGWLHHPRQRGILLDYLHQAEDAGVSLFHMYAITHGLNGESIGSLYSAYHRWNMPAGTGDGSDGQFDNRTGLYDMNKIISVYGGAVRDWSGIPVAR